MKFLPWSTQRVSIGQKFGRYTLLSTHVQATNKYQYYGRCQCECGSKPRYVQLGTLTRGESQSCGCLHLERITKHGLWGTPLFTVWQHMMSRCYNRKDAKFPSYGMRGITVCDEWHDVQGFVKSMTVGFKPGLQIDRQDNDGNYTPENCRWATRSEQGRNKRNNVLVTFEGQTKTLAEWADIHEIKYGTLWDRIKVAKMSPKRAFSLKIK